jgi:hypothetical protein
VTGTLKNVTYVNVHTLLTNYKLQSTKQIDPWGYDRSPSILESAMWVSQFATHKSNMDKKITHEHGISMQAFHIQFLRLQTSTTLNNLFCVATVVLQDSML